MNSPRHPASRLSTLMSRGWRPVEPPRRPVLFVNPRSGDGAATRNGVVERARERGVEAVTLGAGDDLRARALEAVAAGADVLGMAGGDGSLAQVAAVAAEQGLPFVCIPAGTRNHFALDLGVDRQDVPGALDAFTDGVERLIDMGDVNGRIFLNNVSLGIYGEAVQHAGYRDTKVRTLAETAQQRARSQRAHSGSAPCRRHRTRAHADSLFCSSPTTRMRWTVRPWALDRRSPAASWGSWCSTHQTRCGSTLRGEPGALPTSRSKPRATVHAGIDGEAVELVGPLDVRRPPGGSAGPDLRAASRRFAGSPDTTPRVHRTAPCSPRTRPPNSRPVSRLPRAARRESPIQRSSDHGRYSGAKDGADHHITRVVHTRVHSRVGDSSSKQA